MQVGPDTAVWHFAGNHADSAFKTLDTAFKLKSKPYAPNTAQPKIMVGQRHDDFEFGFHSYQMTTMQRSVAGSNYMSSMSMN